MYFQPFFDPEYEWVGIEIQLSTVNELYTDTKPSHARPTLGDH